MGAKESMNAFNQQMQAQAVAGSPPCDLCQHWHQGYCPVPGPNAAAPQVADEISTAFQPTQGVVIFRLISGEFVKAKRVIDVQVDFMVLEEPEVFTIEAGLVEKKHYFLGTDFTTMRLKIDLVAFELC